VSQLVDLSLPLTHEMPRFPGSPPVSVVDDQRFEETGCRTSLLVVGSHTGTHLDAPAHFVEAGETVDAMPLERCIGEALVLDLSRKPPGAEITVEDLTAAAGDDEIGEGARLLVRTDWDRQFGAPGYYADYSPIAAETASWLAQQRVWMLGLDLPTVHPTAYAPIHRTLLEAGIVIVESLANLATLTSKRVFFSGLPLRLAGRDGSPIRAVAYDGVPDGV
jgi:arylformamidase